jgi:superfamily II DNA helicase RecQ
MSRPRSTVPSSPRAHAAAAVASYLDAVARAAIISAGWLAGALGRAPTRRRLLNHLRGTQLPVKPEGGARPPETFALLESHAAAWVDELVERLAEEGFLAIESRVRGNGETVTVTERGASALDRKEPFPPGVLPVRPRLGEHPEVEGRLRSARMEMARSEGVSAFVVFPNATLAAMAAMRPATLADLAAIPGLGADRIRKYGRKILAAIRG